MRVSLLVSPRPTTLLVRRRFSSSGDRLKNNLDRHAPAGLVVLVDERYGEGDDTLLDVVLPEAASGRLPLVLWVHGGGWVGGAKEELRGYFKAIANMGFVVAGPRYSLAPEHQYPTPARQIMRALEYLQSNAARLNIDPDRIAIGGDSAGAQIAAQIAALVTTAGYAEAVGVRPTINPSQLRGVVLACGPYDLSLAARASSPAARRLTQAVMWAYSGTRHFMDDPRFASWSITQNVTAAFPPVLITVGNDDPLRPHSELLAAEFRRSGVELETLFWPDDYRPLLGHQYQFDLDIAAGRQFLDHMHDFLGRRLGQKLGVADPVQGPVTAMPPQA